jgi:Lhr-like helicase
MKNYIAYHDVDMETNIEAPNLEIAHELAEEFGLEVDSIVEAVQDRKTGEFYNPQKSFDEMMNKPEILAVFKRLANR